MEEALRSGAVQQRWPKGLELERGFGSVQRKSFVQSWRLVSDSSLASAAVELQLALALARAMALKPDLSRATKFGPPARRRDAHSNPYIPGSEWKLWRQGPQL